MTFSDRPADPADYLPAGPTLLDEVRDWLLCGLPDNDVTSIARMVFARADGEQVVCDLSAHTVEHRAKNGDVIMWRLEDFVAGMPPS